MYLKYFITTICKQRRYNTFVNFVCNLNNRRQNAENTIYCNKFVENIKKL